MCDAAEILVADTAAVAGATVLYLPETTSTQDVARDLIRQGAVAGTAVVAGYQTAGRGTQGREWFAAPGSGIHLSVLVPVPAKPQAIPWLTPAAAIATAQALRGLASVPPRLKWPNDVLLGGRKVAGVLTEIPAGSALAVVGVGVNVLTSPPAIGATALVEWALHSVKRNDVANRVLRELDHLLARLLAGRLDHVKEAWRLLLDTVGSQVSVERDGQVDYGQATAVDGSGALLVKTGNGGTIRVSAGSGALVRHIG
ncbi:MAG TPA: biotin--[acetyl-CoA-carboxylase] ligase [Chloroflexota bacterium]|nr:biotin--[acetyl-CoA-carboxylase] ligase [Chloroflexota bacterium]